jgi:hypothetical protein
MIAASLLVAPKAYATLTLGATSIASDSNLTLQPTSNVGIGNTNPQALLHIGTAGSRAGIIKVDGATSGTITVQPAATAGTWTLTLPSNDGDSGQVLTTNGSGVTSWTTVSGGGVSCSGCTTNILPKFNGTNLADSQIKDDGTFLDLLSRKTRIGNVTSEYNDTVIEVDDTQSSIGMASRGSVFFNLTGGATWSDNSSTLGANSIILGDVNGEQGGTSFYLNDTARYVGIGDINEMNNATSFTLNDMFSTIGLNAGTSQIVIGSTNNILFLSGRNGIVMQTPGVKPACDLSKRLTWFTTQGGAGVADKMEQCMKKSDDSYVWVTVVTAP